MTKIFYHYKMENDDSCWADEAFMENKSKDILPQILSGKINHIRCEKGNKKVNTGRYSIFHA